jgi:hypothetical protein
MKGGISMLVEGFAPRKWIVAVHRAMTEGIQCWEEARADDDYRRFTATSGTVEGLLYTVVYHADASGRHFQCDCEAGQRDVHLCKHMAAVAMQIGYLDAREVLAEGERIRSHMRAERETAMTAKKLRHALKRTERAESGGFATGDRVRLVAGDMDDPELYAQREGVITKIALPFFTVTLERTQQYPARQVSYGALGIERCHSTPRYAELSQVGAALLHKPGPFDLNLPEDR